MNVVGLLIDLEVVHDHNARHKVDQNLVDGVLGAGERGLLAVVAEGLDHIRASDAVNPVQFHVDVLNVDWSAMFTVAFV